MQQQCMMASGFHPFALQNGACPPATPKVLLLELSPPQDSACSAPHHTHLLRLVHCGTTMPTCSSHANRCVLPGGATAKVVASDHNGVL